jgi:NADPH-dependent glutamate synthase beta subunit-like oxidoreductase/ferredoxin
MKEPAAPHQHHMDRHRDDDRLPGSSSHAQDIDFIRTNIPCQWACPARTDVPGYIEAISRGDYGRAYQINRTCNLFPGVLGRICSRPCEAACRHGETGLGEPVAICHLKRIAADEKDFDHLISEAMFARTGKSVGVVGAGPAGLAAAHSMTLFGHQVTIYDAFESPGGMLLNGIPDFRLPRDILNEEIFNVIRLGIQLETGLQLGKDITLRELLLHHDAVILALGCFKPRSLGIPGEQLPGVFSGLDMMMDVNSGLTPVLGDDVLVIGGGFTAMDCARTARRLGARNVTICIRNVEEDLTVTKDEVLETKREDVKIVSLVSASEIVGKETVEGVLFRRNRFGGVRGGRGRSVIPIEGSEFTIHADTVISAIGQTALQTAYSDQFPDGIAFDRETGVCPVENLFGAGDFVRGASTVIEAIGHGKQVAESADLYLMGQHRREKIVRFRPGQDTHRKRVWDFIPRHEIPVLDIEDRFKSQDTEVETGFPREMGHEESKRCYLCNLKYEINIPGCIYCRWCIDVCPRDCIELAGGFEPGSGTPGNRLTAVNQWNKVAGIVIDNDRCIRCGECLRICPTDCIHVVDVTLQERLVSGSPMPDNGQTTS